jgi:hypothetical protein
MNELVVCRECECIIHDHELRLKIRTEDTKTKEIKVTHICVDCMDKENNT